MDGLGHGGADAANYVRLNLFNNVLNNPNFTSDPSKAVGELPFLNELPWESMLSPVGKRDTARFTSG